MFNLKEAKDQDEIQRIVREETKKVERDPFYRSPYIDDYVYMPLEYPDLGAIENWNENSPIGVYVPEGLDENDWK